MEYQLLKIHDFTTLPTITHIHISAVEHDMSSLTLTQVAAMIKATRCGKGCDHVPAFSLSTTVVSKFVSMSLSTHSSL